MPIENDPLATVQVVVPDHTWIDGVRTFVHSCQESLIDRFAPQFTRPQLKDEDE